jgi:MFS family permease
LWVQAAGLFIVAILDGFVWWLLGSVLLGIGTAMVYPSLLAAVSDAADPTWRARALSVYRFWRDLGYAIGALTAGLLAAIVGFAWTITAIGLLTFGSGIAVTALMKEQPR